MAGRERHENGAEQAEGVQPFAGRASGSENRSGPHRVEPELEEPQRPSPPPAKAGSEAAPDPEPGERIAEYLLLEQLGKGGAGSVFKVRREPDGAILALKVLAASKVRRARIVQRFFDEVRAASAVQHPGLVQVVDFIEQERPRRLAYAMEYVPGEVLRARLKREGILDLRRAIQIGVRICDALTALHDAGIIHRDLKPENILVAEAVDGGPPVVKLFDFGVVKFLPVDRTVDRERPNQPGTFVGTPRYMAPEQAAGASVDHRADLFALGVMLFEMITGRCPHEGDSLRDVVMAKLKGAPRITVSPEREILPHELTDIVDRCLQLKPALRPRDAKQVGTALRDAELVLFTVGSMRAASDGTAVRMISPADPPPWVSNLGSSASSGGVSAHAPSEISSFSAPPAGPPPIFPSAVWGDSDKPRSVSRGVTLVGMVVLAVALAVAARFLFGAEEVVVFEPGAVPLETGEDLKTRRVD